MTTPVTLPIPWLVLILSAPSGAGKTTLKNRFLQEHPEFRFSVSHTTRPIRPHEQHGREYHFVSKEKFDFKARSGEFLEYATVFGNSYGTHRDELGDRRPAYSGVILDIDVQGARQVLESGIDAVTVFILPPSFEVLERRLRNRKDEPEESIQRRLAGARSEVEQCEFFNYLIVSDTVDRASQDLHAIVTAERCRRTRRAPHVASLLRHGTLLFVRPQDLPRSFFFPPSSANRVLRDVS